MSRFCLDVNVMDAKKILNPKGWLIGLGILVILLASGNIAGSEEVAKTSWGEDNIKGNEAAYEEMWALHMIPLGVMAITTGLVVKGKALAQMAMAASGSIIVIVGGGMGFMTQKHDYGTSGGAATLIPLIVMLLVILLGVSGYMHKDDAEEAGE